MPVKLKIYIDDLYEAFLGVFKITSRDCFMTYAKIGIYFTKYHSFIPKG